MVVESIKEFLLFVSPRDIKLLQKEEKRKKATWKEKFLFASLPLGPEFIPKTNNLHSQDKGAGWKRACWVSLLSGSISTEAQLTSLNEMRLVELSSFYHSRKKQKQNEVV